MSDEERVKNLLIEALQILGFAGEIFDKKEIPEISPKKPASGTDFSLIHAKDTEFDLKNVTIEIVYDKKSGVSNNKEWAKQSIMISDADGQQHELIAWGDHMNHYAGLKKGQVINVLVVGKCTEYKGKLQFTLGGNSEIQVVGGQHIL